MNFLAGIITENEHNYDQLTGKNGKMVRLIENESYRPTSDGAMVNVRTFVQIIDEKGNETLKFQPDSTPKQPLFYTNAELDAFFSSFNDPIEPNESYTGEFKKILEAVLLQDTMGKGYFNGDTCVPYVPIA